MSKLIVCMATLSSGGAERVLSVLSKPLVDKFNSVTYVMWVEASIFYQIDKRVRLVSIQKEIGTGGELKRMYWFRQFVECEKPDLILSFLEPINLRVLMCTMGLGIKTIVAERNDPHGVNKFWMMDQIEKFVYSRADKILVQTATIKRFFDGKLKKKTHVIYNPVVLSEDMVGKALITPKKKRIVSVARLKPQKGHDMLIKAFAKFCKSHPDYSLTIYGSGPQRDKLEQLAARLRVGNKVFLPGVIKNIHQEILDAEIFSLASCREGMSNSMIEAMCLGLPCVCSRVSGAVDLIEDGRNGLLVDVGDEEALFQQFCRVADNHDLASQLGNNAKNLFYQLRIEVITRRWIELLS